MRSLLPLLCSCLAAVASGQGNATAPAPAAQARPAPATALDKGDKLPPVVIDDLRQTEARSFSDFYGRAVLLEFFAYWCGPCARSVPHLNELQARYGARGLSIVAVTTEAEKKTLPWIEKNQVEYAYGRDTAGELHKLFQIKGIPFSALIDPFGTVVWTGHPQQLSNETIESALAHVLPRPAWEWPEDTRPLLGLLAKGDYAAALQEAARLPARDGFDFPALVRDRIAPQVTAFQGLAERAEYASAFRLGERLEKELAGLPEGEPVSARMQALRADPAIARQVTAERRMTEFEERAGVLRKPEEMEALQADVAKFVEEKPGPKLERRAKILLGALDRGLERLGKKPPAAKPGDSKSRE